MGELSAKALELIPGKDGYLWETGYFDVPAGWTEAQVQAAAVKARNQFGSQLEARGYRVVGIAGPMLPKDDWNRGRLNWEDPERKRYILRAYVWKRPTVQVFRDMPDELVPQALAEGARLLD